MAVKCLCFCKKRTLGDPPVKNLKDTSSWSPLIGTKKGMGKLLLLNNDEQGGDVGGGGNFLYI